jgi:hypothetical protein
LIRAAVVVSSPQDSRLPWYLHSMRGTDTCNALVWLRMMEVRKMNGSCCKRGFTCPAGMLSYRLLS